MWSVVLHLVKRALTAPLSAFFLDDTHTTVNETTLNDARHRYADYVLHRCLQLAVAWPASDTRPTSDCSLQRVSSEFVSYFAKCTVPFVQHQQSSNDLSTLVKKIQKNLKKWNFEFFLIFFFLFLKDFETNSNNFISVMSRTMATRVTSSIVCIHIGLSRSIRRKFQSFCGIVFRCDCEVLSRIDLGWEKTVCFFYILYLFLLFFNFFFSKVEN